MSYPTKRHIYPLPLSCPLRAYLSVAPAHSDMSVGTRISVGLHLGKIPGATPCYSPHKSVGTRSGVVPGAQVGGLASWDIGAPRSDRQALPEKRGTDLVLRQVLAWQKSPFLYCHRKGTSAFQHPRFTRSVDLPAYSARDEGGTTSYGGTLPGTSGVATGILCGGCSRQAQGTALRRLPPRGICVAASDRWIPTSISS